MGAYVLKIREDGRVRSRSALLVFGLYIECYWEGFGFMLGDSEFDASLSQFFSWLKSRFLRGVELVVSDDHGCLGMAVRRFFQGVTWHRCHTQFMRIIMDATPLSAKDELYPLLRAFLDAPDNGTARL